MKKIEIKQYKFPGWVVEHWTTENSLFAVPGSNLNRYFHFLLQKRIAGSNPGSEWHFSTRILPPCSLNWFSLLTKEMDFTKNGRTLSNFLFCHFLFSNLSKKSRFFWLPSLKVKIRSSYDIPQIIANYFMHQKFWKMTSLLCESALLVKEKSFVTFV